MPIYVCDKCSFETPHKSKIVRHFNKKNPCRKEKIIVNKEIMNFIYTDISVLKEIPVDTIKYFLDNQNQSDNEENTN